MRSSLPFLFAVFLVSLVPARALALDAFVSILPQKYFLEKVGGEHVTPHVMVQPGASPAIYEPKPRQMAALSEASVYFAIGVPFENAWLQRFASANPGLKIVHSEKNIKKQPIGAHSHDHDHEHAKEHAKAHGHGEHDHGEHGHGEKADDDHAHGEQAHAGHSHEIMDPHVWLAPRLAKIIAANMRKALAEADPEHAADYAANLEAFHKECDALDARLHEMLGRLKPPHNAFMVFHPSWGYFARAYGLRQIAIEIEGKEPSPAELQQLIEKARQENVHVIFVQPQFSKKSAELVAQSIDGSVQPLDPLAEDWHNNLIQAAEAIYQAVQDK